MSVEVAARTTEHAGANLLAIGVSCHWTLATIGPWRAEIPTPVVPIPVYAQVPVTASADIGGSLSAFQINVASTHDMTLDLGHSNHFSLQEQGSNVWTSGVLTWSGEADLGVKLAVQFGIGDPKVGNFHLDVGVGAQAAFNTNKTCEVEFIPGSLDAGVKVGPFSGAATLWSAMPYPLWKGCKGGGGGGGGGGVTLQNPGDQRSPVGSPLSLQTHATDTAPGTLIYSATGLPPGLSIDATTGLISGSPTTVGSYTTSVGVKDSTGPSAQQQFGWTITSSGTQVQATSIAAGGDWSACVRLSSGSLNCWGFGGGDLGTGSTGGSNIPIPVSGISNATQVSTSGCAVLATGPVNCWGVNDTGELGDGTTTGPQTCSYLGTSYPCSTTPLAVNGITTATQVSSTGGHACALLSGGGVDCWGWNGAGQLGRGTTTGPDYCSNESPSLLQCSGTPVAVSGITNAVQISTGAGDFTCALLSTGHIDCWGWNGEGELGNGTTTGPDCNGSCSSSPVQVSGITNAVQISAGAWHVCAVLSTGSVVCWGWNPNGELGDGVIGGPDMCQNGAYCSATPVAVSGIANAAEVTSGWQHTCARVSTGAVECWGDNANGQLGSGSTGGPDTCAL